MRAGWQHLLSEGFHRPEPRAKLARSGAPVQDPRADRGRTTGGRNAGVPRGRALSFLALLLVHRGAIVRVDRVVDELWGDARPEEREERRPCRCFEVARCGGRRCPRVGGRRLRRPSVAGRARRRSLRGMLPAWTGRARPRRASGGGGDVAARARALARPGACRCPGRGLRPAGDRAARRPPPRVSQRALRRRSGLGATRRGHRRARSARAGAPVSRAPPRPAHALLLSRRPPGRCACGLPGCSPCAGRRARHRALAALRESGGSHPAPGCPRTGIAAGAVSRSHYRSRPTPGAE